MEELHVSAAGVEHVNSHAVKCAVNCGTDIHRDKVTLQRYCTSIMCYSTNYQQPALFIVHNIVYSLNRIWYQIAKKIKQVAKAAVLHLNNIASKNIMITMMTAIDANLPSFKHASRVSTLAERFELTSFKPFQKEIIDMTIKGKDSLVIQPTGSGKSLCF